MGSNAFGNQFGNPADAASGTYNPSPTGLPYTSEPQSYPGTFGNPADGATGQFQEPSGGQPLTLPSEASNGNQSFGEGPLQNSASAQSGAEPAQGMAYTGSSGLPTFANGMSGTVNGDGSVDYSNAGQANLMAPGQTGTVGDNTAANGGGQSVTLDEISVAGESKGASDGNAVDTTGSMYTQPGDYTLSNETYDYFQNQYGNDGYDSAGGYDGGYGDGGGSAGSGGYGPIVLDLNGDGINITQKSSSNTFFDMAGDGYQHHTAWAGAGDGVLVLDADGDGKITQQNEVVFTDWDPTATSDMQALLDVFDTNHNGQLDSGDAKFSSFKIMVTNADGTTSLQTLAQAGITAINLKSDKTRQTFTDGSSIDGQTTFTRSNGTTGTAATVTFAYDTADLTVKSSTTRNSDGSTTIDNKAFAPNGKIAAEIIATTSANGLTRTTKFDQRGDGVFEDVQTDAIVNNSDGSRTETLTDATATGVVLDRFTTTTSADRKTVTILRDTDGSGATDQKEVDATASDGSKSVTVTDLAPNGSTIRSVQSLVSADGQTGTTKTDLDGNGVYDLTKVDQTITNSGGSRTQTISDTNADGTLRDRTILTTSADAASQTIQTDFNGDGVYDLTRTSSIVRNSDNSTTTTQTDKNADGSLRGSVTTQISANGLSTTTKTDADGNGTVDLTHTDATVVNSDGSRTETISDLNVKGSLLDRTVIVKGADGVTRTTSIDSDGNGKYDTVDQVTVASGAVTETVSTYLPDGTTLKSRKIVSTSADGLTKTTQNDFNGDTRVDGTSTVQTVKNSDGSSTVTTSERAYNNALADQSVVTTSADGLTVTTKNDLNGDGKFDFTTVAQTVVNSDGSRTTTASTTSYNGTLQSKVVTAVSADRNTTTITSDANGDRATDSVETIARQANGSVIDTVKTYGSNGTLIATGITTTSANGLSRTVQADVDGNGTVDTTETTATVLNNDGSRTTTTTLTGSGSALLKKSVATTSATGLSTTVQTDVDGNGSMDATTTSVTVLNKDGSRTTTAKQAAGGKTLRGTVTTVSATGLSTTTVSDRNGDGTTDRTNTDVTTLNADGTTTETVSDKSGSGVLMDQTITTTSADRKTVTVARNIDGTGSADDTETTAVQSNGSVVYTNAAVNAAGTPIQKIVKTTAANGLSYTQTLDSNNDGTVDETQSDGIVFNADGSTTETYSDANTSNNIQPGSYGDNSKIVTQTSANGLSKTITVTGNNEGFSIDHTTTDVTSIGADGSRTETRTVSATDNGTAYTVSKMVITDAAHGLSHTVQLDEYGTGTTYNITDATVINSDGSKTETYTENNQDGTLAEKDITTTSANGRTITMQNDTDGDTNVDETKTSSLAADGSRTDIIATTTNGGALLSKTVVTTSADGRSQKTTYDYDGDGKTDATVNQVSVVNSDGTTTQTRSDLNANGSLHDKIVTTTSANGFAITGTIDLNGDGTVDENFSDQIVLKSDGTTTETAQTTYADGSLKAKTVTSTSANGLTVTINQDFNGDGKTDVTEVDNTASSGVKTATVSHFNSAGTLVSKDVTTTSADGRQSTVSRDFNGDGVQDVLETEDHVADGNGSYDIATEDAYSALYEGNHSVDENGVDQINMTPDGGQSGYYHIETLRQEAHNYQELNRLYDVLLDRDVTSAEHQSYLQYNDFNGVIAAVMSSTEFTQKYGSVTDAQFVEQMFDNAYGRSAKLSELNGWVSKLKAGTAQRRDVVGALADSAEHQTDGNTHAVTNNSQNVSGQFTLDHTVDKVTATNIVDRLYVTTLNRHADTSGSSSNSAAILAGTTTESQIANNLIGSSEFKSDYGSLTDSQFVTQMFQNGLHRAPTSSELSSWTQTLGSGAISRADFVVGVADSPDYFSASSSSGTATSSAMRTSSTSSTSSPQQSSSLNRMVQAMSVIGGSSSSAWSPAIAGSQPTHEQTLAAATH